MASGNGMEVVAVAGAAVRKRICRDNRAGKNTVGHLVVIDRRRGTYGIRQVQPPHSAAPVKRVHFGVGQVYHGAGWELVERGGLVRTGRS